MKTEQCAPNIMKMYRMKNQSDLMNELQRPRRCRFERRGTTAKELNESSRGMRRVLSVRHTGLVTHVDSAASLHWSFAGKQRCTPNKETVFFLFSEVKD